MANSLQNKVLISTRPAGQNNELKALFEKEGAKIIEMPTIKITASQLQTQEINALKKLEDFTWIVFTSPNGIRFFFKQLKELNGNHLLPKAIKTAVVGTKTNEVLAEFGYEATIKNPGNTGIELATKLWGIIKDDDQLLFPEGDIARQTISKMLGRIAKCTNIVVYKNETPEQISSEHLQLIKEDKYDYIIATSPSGYNNLVTALGVDFSPASLRIISIGTTTSEAVKVKGYIPELTARMANAEGIFQEIKNHYNKPKN